MPSLLPAITEFESVFCTLLNLARFPCFAPSPVDGEAEENKQASLAENKRIALDDYPRLAVRFYRRSIHDPFMRVCSPIFRNSVTYL